MKTAATTIKNSIKQRNPQPDRALFLVRGNGRLGEPRSILLGGTVSDRSNIG